MVEISLIPCHQAASADIQHLDNGRLNPFTGEAWPLGREVSLADIQRLENARLNPFTGEAWPEGSEVSPVRLLSYCLW